MNQRETFLAGEADAYYLRNYAHQVELLASADADPVVAAVSSLGHSPRSILEVGCSDGWRLEALRVRHGARCCGVDPSDEAVREGSGRFPELNLRRGTADTLPVETGTFELVIFGFCLYLCDRPDLFRIAAEADRALKDGGQLIVYDFCPPFPYRTGYGHRPGLFSYKMDYTRMFIWNPAYSLISHSMIAHGGETGLFPDNRIAVAVLRKDPTTAYPHEPDRRSDQRHTSAAG